MSAGHTIFAVSSGSGLAAVSVIRISGTQSGHILQALAGRLPVARSYTVAVLRAPQSGEILDQCVVVWLPAPGSYTGEDSVELFVHGGRATVSSLLNSLTQFPDCRMAEAGEFTRRAVLNGKMDLVETEGLGDLLAAETAQQRRQALGVMLGHASGVFEKWRQDSILIRSNIEAALDFSDEEGVFHTASTQIDLGISTLLGEMTSELARAHVARAIRDGVRVVLAGLPNTGKSSLLNALVGREAAIVSAIPGTTRDVIEVRMDLAGIPVLLTDTAGLRGSTDVIEAEGIRRGQARIAEADIVVWISAPDVQGSQIVWPGVTPQLRVMAKSDQVTLLQLPSDVIPVSVKTGAGIDDFVSRLTALVRDRFQSEEGAVVVSARQHSLIQNSIRLLNEAMAVDPKQLELKAYSIARAGDEIGRITGRIDVEEWLGAIFSRFCIGK